MPAITVDEAGSQNRVAFLDMVAFSEIGPWLLANSDNGYNLLVGSYAPHMKNGVQIPANILTFPSYADHPNIYNKETNSTAAGRGQLLGRWWFDSTINGRLNPGYKRTLKLQDFSPINQDRVSLQQIRECHAFAAIDGGNFAQAVALCNHIWASLTGSPYGQHTNDIGMLQAAYVAAGGIVSGGIVSA